MSTQESLAGKNAVITGATRGIGLAIAEALAREGLNVAVCGRSQEHLNEAVRRLREIARGKVVGKVADVRRSTEVAALFAWVNEELGVPDVLVNNAGVGIFKRTAELTVEDWETTVGTNLSGVFYCCREALPRMRNRAGSYVINIGSLAGKNAFAGGAAYNASKFGLSGFTEAMMLDHRYEGVRVTQIMPGSVNTAFGGAEKGSDWKIAPDDIAAVVLNLLQIPERTLVSRVEIRPSKPSK